MSIARLIAPLTDLLSPTNFCPLSEGSGLRYLEYLPATLQEKRDSKEWASIWSTQRGEPVSDGFF